MNTESIIGNEAVKRELKKNFHAYIIEGPSGSGKTTLAELIAQGNVCVSQGERPCGKCPSCIKFAAGCNIDVMRIPSDTDVKNMRAAIGDLYVRPNESEKRCYIIEDGDGLSVQCQNILLKSLEEPPSFSVFIITCTLKEKLLETIRSRCVTLTLSPLHSEDIINYLARPQFGKYTPQQKKAAADLSEGYLGRAIKLLEGEAFGAYGLCEKFTDACLDGVAAEALKIASFKSREELQDFVGALGVYLASRIRAVPDKKTANRLFSMSVAVENVARNAEYNVNVKLWNVVLVKKCLKACEPIS